MIFFIIGMTARIVAAKLEFVLCTKLVVKFINWDVLVGKEYLKKFKMNGALHHSHMDFNKLCMNAKTTTKCQQFCNHLLKD